MKIAYVTTYPPKACGIASYTDTVAKAVADQPEVDVTIISEASGAKIHDNIDVFPVFNIGDDFTANILATINEIKPDIVHLQHTPDILGMDDRMFALLDGIKKAGIKSVVTPHTIYDFFSGLLERKPGAPKFNRQLGEHADAIIAHQESMIETLKSHGVDSHKMHLIPHWTGNTITGDEQAIREKSGLDKSHKLLLFFGFIHVQKNIHTPIKAMKEVVAKVPEARLVIAGSIAGNSWYNRLYTKYLEWLVSSNGLSDHVILDKRFIPDDDMNAYYAASDLILLPHLQGYASASGVAHQALAARKPMLCSQAPKFEEIGKHISKDLILPSRDHKAWANAIIKILESGKDEEMIKKINTYADETSINTTAQNHVKIYEELG